MKNKIIRDPIHGYISVDQLALNLIDTYAFQRLRRIRQSGCYTVYPSANHTRFEHSIGVMHLGCEAFRIILEKLPSEDAKRIEKYEKTVRFACLLHDLGHAPLSHTGEVFFDKAGLIETIRNMTGIELDKGHEHELMSCVIALEVFKDELKDIDKELFCRMITGSTYSPTTDLNRLKNGIIEILNSSVDVDKLDYLSRDSFSSGTGNTLVSIDTERLIRAFSIIGGRLCLDTSALSVIANFVYARNTLHMWVYKHHITLYTDYIMHNFIEKIINESPDVQEQYFSIEAVKDRLVDDYDIYSLFKKKRNNEPYHNLYEQLFSRKHYKVVWKNQFQLKDLIKDEGKIESFKDIDPENIRRDLCEALGVDNEMLYVIRADYDFSKPKVFINANGKSKDFATFYQKDIYNNLMESVPMIYVNPTIPIDTVKEKLKKIYGW